MPEGKTVGTQDPSLISTRLRQIAELARRKPDTAFTSLSHHIDLRFLYEAYRLTRKDGAVGIDGVTAEEYEEHLEENLGDLLERFKSGRYFAPPVRRVHIPKGDSGKTRPIGIPTLEDKVLQRAVAMLLGAVYEEDFLDCSYGFRVGRSAHMALDSLWRALTKVHGGWVLDVDIKSFFDGLDHGHLAAFLDKRVRDGVLRRVIGKWLNAGVLEEGTVTYPGAGTPQGGVISPLLANLYLHEVLDLWFEREVKGRLQGEAFLVRYADDFVVVCETGYDAHRLFEVLPKRFGRFGLTLHPEKTRLVQFLPPSERPAGQPGPGDSGSPETFDLLGFTHYWGASRRGAPVVKRKTARGRFGRALRAISGWLEKNRHLPIREQQRVLTLKLRGHDAYYGITGNGTMLARFRQETRKLWWRWLRRRGGKAQLTWERFLDLYQRFSLPGPRIVHSIYNRCAANP